MGTDATGSYQGEVVELLKLLVGDAVAPLGHEVVVDPRDGNVAEQHHHCFLRLALDRKNVSMTKFRTDAHRWCHLPITNTSP